ncbi:MAG: LTA synthase family protein [Oscillospiraceae bacterium]
MKYLKEKAYKKSSWILNVLAMLLVPTITLITMEWIHRGGFSAKFFTENLGPHFVSFFMAWLFLTFFYALISQISGMYWLATLLTGIVGNAPATVTYFKLQMRGEPFLPWDLLQLGDFLGVADKVKLIIQPSMYITLIIFIVLTVASAFIHLPYSKYSRLKCKFVGGIASFVGVSIIIAAYLSSGITMAIGIYPDMWMQDRYYRNHGVITGFATNLQALKIKKPNDYSKKKIEEIKSNTQAVSETRKPLYEKSLINSNIKTPNIIFLMNESFWDVTRLPNIKYSEDITPNMKRLENTGAYGMVYSPSFGGGTCDVEFEALTGFSLEHLPAGAKPYQQHITQDTFSLPQYLKTLGYTTEAIHGYHRKFWSRDVAYPRLGIDKFFAYDDFVNPDKRRGFISDAQMTKQIITEYENRTTDAPMFIHAVTMQNHTTYDEANYPENELVKITEYPKVLSDETIGQLRDFATGVMEADAALGTLVDYFSEVDEPTIIVFWGDHFNPIGKGYELYEETGFTKTDAGGTTPELHETDLRIWSNYCDTSINLGTIASYNITPVMMDIFGLDKPFMFEYLAQQLPVMRARSRGVTVNPDGSFSEEMTETQQETFDNHAILQYDFMFGEHYLQDYTKH